MTPPAPIQSAAEGTGDATTRVGAASASTDPLSSSSMSERYQWAAQHYETDPARAIELLTSIQTELAVSGTFSSNETIDDIGTFHLQFLTCEHLLAMSYCQLPSNTAAGAATAAQERVKHLSMACDLWEAFLHRLDRLELLSRQEQEQYHDLVEATATASASTTTTSEGGGPPSMALKYTTTNRDVKIARYQAKRTAELDRSKLQGLLERRKRLGIQAQDEMDGYDEEGLVRSVFLRSLEIAKVDAFDEWTNTIRELPMLAMMVMHQSQHDSRYVTSTSPNDTRLPRPPTSESKPLQVTHVTQNAVTGQLQFRREEIRSQVFRPGWNLPTMSLEELAQREVQDALEREERTKQAEAAQKEAPRRYDQLVKDGMEDNADLVDASAELDRKWDDWKDENPRGSGNKRGDVGDRNF